MNFIRGLFILFAFHLPVVIYAQRNIDVQHYKFEIELSDQSDTIHGKATIRVKFLQAAQVIILDLKTHTNEGKGMKVEKITGNNVRGFMRYDDSIVIALIKPPAINDTATYTIIYAGIPYDGLIIAKNKYGHRTFFADNWPDRGHNWLPCVDDVADKASVEFIVTAPDHYSVVSNGVLVKETALPGMKKSTYWKEDVPLSTKVMVIGVAEFAVNQSGMVADSIPVTSWVYPENKDKGFYDYALAAEILPYFIKLIGPYGYKKLANVQSKTIFGGLENANTIFYAENTVTGVRRFEELIAHEVAHQWFGNMATEKTFAHLWLSEGFATYMAVMYMQNKHGEDTAIAMLKKDREQAVAFARSSEQPVVDSVSGFMQLLNANSYQKGGWILHMLREQLGDSVFIKSIRSYYAQYAGKNADTRDLQHVFETVSGQNLKVFFDQWLYAPGVPRLDIQWSWSEKDKKFAISIKQLQKTPFQFPLELIVQSADGEEFFELVKISKAEHTLTFSLDKKPKAIVADPGTKLLFEASVKESGVK